MSKFKLILNGLFKENPVLRLVLGTCPSLAISVTVSGGLGMGLAATFVLIGSNMVIASLRKVISEKVRIPCYITVIASFTTIIMMLVQAFLPSLHESLGVYLPLITVNCIILGRAEMFASKNTVFDSMLDGIGMGLGFTMVLVAMGTIREVLGSGSWFGLRLFPEDMAVRFFVTAPGGFFTFGVVMAVLCYFLSRKKDAPAVQMPVPGCAEGCASCGECCPNEGGNA